MYGRFIPTFTIKNGPNIGFLVGRFNHQSGKPQKMTPHQMDERHPVQTSTWLQPELFRNPEGCTFFWWTGYAPWEATSGGGQRGNFLTRTCQTKILEYLGKYPGSMVPRGHVWTLKRKKSPAQWRFSWDQVHSKLTCKNAFSHPIRVFLIAIELMEGFHFWSWLDRGWNCIWTCVWCFEAMIHWASG